MAWTNADGSVTLSDRHNIGYAGSAIDPQQDLQLHAGSGRNKSAGAPANAHVYHFSRPYFTNDTRDITIQRTSAQFWIFAYAGERPASDDPSAPVSVHIWKEAPAAQDLLDDDTAMDDPAEPDGNAGDEVDAGVVGNSHSYDEAATSEYAFALPHGKPRR